MLLSFIPLRIKTISVFLTFLVVNTSNLFSAAQHLLDKMNDCMAKPACRLPTLMLLGHVVRKQPSWIHKMARYPLLLSLLKCLKVSRHVGTEHQGEMVWFVADDRDSHGVIGFWWQ